MFVNVVGFFLLLFFCMLGVCECVVVKSRKNCESFVSKFNRELEIFIFIVLSVLLLLKLGIFGFMLFILLSILRSDVLECGISFDFLGERKMSFSGGVAGWELTRVSGWCLWELSVGGGFVLLILVKLFIVSLLVLMFNGCFIVFVVGVSSGIGSKVTASMEMSLNALDLCFLIVFGGVWLGVCVLVLCIYVYCNWKYFGLFREVNRFVIFKSLNLTF